MSPVTVPVLTAVTHRWESRLAEALGRCPQVHLARRCADLAELLGTVAAGVGQVAVVSVDLRGLDRSALAEVTGAGVLVLGVHPPGDEAGERTLRRWGVDVLVPADVDDDRLREAVDTLLEGDPADADRLAAPTAPAAAERRPVPAAAKGGSDDPTRNGAEDDPTAGPAGRDRRGELVVVWGPGGAPGRSTLALNLAAELAGGPEADPVLLVDADTYGATQAQLLAVLDEAPGLLAAARAADHGTLDAASLSGHAPEVLPGLRVLTGVPRADRWPELREPALRDVLEECTRLARWTVVDVASCLEEDEELSFDTAAPRRNGAALVALDVADHLVVVGLGDPVGLQRLVRGLDRLRQVCARPPTVVVNRVRPGAVGSGPARRIAEALERFAGISDVLTIPEDQAGLDAAVLSGQALREVRPRSPARQAVVQLAARVAGRPAGVAPGRRSLARWSPRQLRQV